VSISETEPAVWFAVSNRRPSRESARATGERCGSTFAPPLGDPGAASAPFSLMLEGIVTRAAARPTTTPRTVAFRIQRAGMLIKDTPEVGG
jgi:hypothetical protein